MSDLIECIPNISEGRDLKILDELSKSITKINGVKLLHRDIGFDANRTVFTFAGPSESVIEAAYQLIKKVHHLIDMRNHHGNHPRIGAVDVCPFVAISGIDKSALVEKVNKLGKKVAEDVQIPIFLYEQNARTEPRRLLGDIRRGEYEGLADKLQQKEWLPDFGTSQFKARFGGMVMGVRNFLIAYNVNVHGGKPRNVKDIAAQVREKGNYILNNEYPSRLKSVRAIGWKVKEHNCLQVSTNLTDFETTGVHTVFEAVKALAEDLGLIVKGSQLIGLIPQEALLQAGRFYAKKDGLLDSELIQLAVEQLGLGSLETFILEERILEYMIKSAPTT